MSTIITARDRHKSFTFIASSFSALRLATICLLAGALIACGGGSSSPNVVTTSGGGTGTGGTPPPSSGNYYVATNGNDSWSGTLSSPNSAGTDGPFATIAKAQQVVESSKSTISGNVTIQIRGGTYFLSAPLSFSSADSGTSSQQITWEGYPGDTTPVISAGQQVTGWKNVSGSTWSVQLPSSFSDFEALYYNGQRRFRPRTSSGYLRLNPVILSSPQTNCTESYAGGYRCSDRFSFSPGDLASSYHDINDVEIISFELWTVSRMRLQSVDTTNNIAYLTGSVSNGQYFGFIEDHRYQVDNVQESLNEPGEWYLDKGTSPWTLTYIAQSGETPSSDTIIVPQQSQILVANGLQYVTFSGLEFSHDDYVIPATGHPGNSGEVSTPAAISINNSSNVTFTGVTASHTQGWGLEFIGTAAAGAGNTVTNSIFYDLGTGGIRLGQVPASSDSDSTVAQNNTVSQSLIFSGGRFLPGGEGTGVWIGSSHSNTVSHVDIHDFYNGPIELGQTPNGGETFTHDNVIDSNELYDLGQGVTDDMGCVHAASSNNSGNQITNNVCHDVTHDPSPGGYGGNGIYLDANTQNVTVKNNLVYRVSDTALFLNGSTSGNVVENNIFAYSGEGMIRRGIIDPAGSFEVEHNIFYYDHGALQRLPSIWVCPSICTSQFTMDYNVYWNATGSSVSFVTTVSGNPDSIAEQFDLASWQALTGEDVHSTVANPEFTAPGSPSDDYSLMSGSPATSSEGFTPLSTAQAGPTGNLVTPATPVPDAFPLQPLALTDF